MPSHYVYATLANEVYNNDGGKPPAPWRIYDAAYPHNSAGIGCAAYINDDTKEIVIAIRGTSNLEDFWADILLFFNQVPNNTSGFAQFVNNAKNRHQEQHRENILNLAGALMRDYAEQPNIFIRIVRAIFGPIVAYFYPNLAANNPFWNQQNNLEQIDDLLYPNLREAIDQIRQQLRDYQISLTGHSLGAVMAELCASTLCLPAVTFESPGCKNIAIKQNDYNQEAANAIICYLAAPTWINTCHMHIGQCQRLYIPHVEEGFSLSHTTQCIWGTVGRLITYSGFFGATKKAAELGVVAAKNAAKELAKKYGGYYAAYTGVGIGKDWQWSMNQHRLTQILLCFDPITGNPRPYINPYRHGLIGEVVAWPQRGEQSITSRLKRTVSEILPFKQSNRGIHTLIFSTENEVIEAQIEESSGYQVRKRLRTN